jgi:hypothetical protein
MLTASFRRKTLLILLVALVGTPVLAAVNLKPGRPTLMQRSESGALDLLSRIWSFFGSGSKEGCHIDPSGCRPNLLPHTKAGCEIDPSGCSSPQSNPTTKAGCNIDPSGGPCLP